MSRLLLITLLPLTLAVGCKEVGQPASKERIGSAAAKAETIVDQQLEVQGGPYELFGRRFHQANIEGQPILVVVLHGDTPRERPDYQNVMARKIAEANKNVLAIALLRPGYVDADGNASEGERGDSVGDNWNAESTESVAAAVEQLRVAENASQVVLVGHSGGSAIAANVVTRHPSLVDAIVLVSFPGDVNRWRQHMLATTKLAAFDGDIDSLSVLDGIQAIEKSLRITVVVGDADDVTPPKLALHYKDRLAKLGITVELVRIANAGHNIFLEPEVLQSVSKVVSELATEPG